MKRSALLLACWGPLLLPLAAQGVVYYEDFSTLDPSEWTHRGSDAIRVEDGKLLAHGSRDSDPASRITHAMSTGTGDFRAEFDIRRTGYEGSGAIGIGWMNIDEYASVQDHDTLEFLHGWNSQDSAGNPSSGIWLWLTSGSPHGSWLTSTDDGTKFGDDEFDMGLLDDNEWCRMAFGRSGLTAYLEVHDMSGDSTLSAYVALPNQDEYGFFHISTIDNMSNSWWVDYEFDNLVLTPEPASLSMLALGGLGLCCGRRRWLPRG
ncbi:MAG: PEP-CTERM sorting domain-containing protein [bacterium]|nr:PEP-CTERM sorting domain-containing protein [bacterium]